MSRPCATSSRCGPRCAGRPTSPATSRSIPGCAGPCDILSRFVAILDRKELEQSPLADLHAIASELGIEGYRRLRREELIDALLAGAGDGAGGEAEAARRPPPRGRDRRARARPPPLGALPIADPRGDGERPERRPAAGAPALRGPDAGVRQRAAHGTRGARGGAVRQGIARGGGRAA